MLVNRDEKQRAHHPRHVRKRRRKNTPHLSPAPSLKSPSAPTNTSGSTTAPTAIPTPTFPRRQSINANAQTTFHSAQSLHHHPSRQDRQIEVWHLFVTPASSRRSLPGTEVTTSESQARADFRVALTLDYADVTLLNAHARMRAVDLIRKKRDSGEHSREEINFSNLRLHTGEIPDYQMSAWLMAAWIRGLNNAERASLTGSDALFRRSCRPLRSAREKSRQTLHRRSRRQNFSDSRAHRSGRRDQRSHD